MPISRLRHVAPKSGIQTQTPSAGLELGSSPEFTVASFVTTKSPVVRTKKAIIPSILMAEWKPSVAVDAFKPRNQRVTASETVSQQSSTEGSPIGLLLALTYASNINIVVSSDFTPRSRIHSHG